MSDQKQIQAVSEDFGGFDYTRLRHAEKKGVRYFSVVDFIEELTDSTDPTNYWTMLKSREPQLSTNCGRFKLVSKDGKMRMTECADVEQLLRIVQSVPSPKAEPAKRWLVKVGMERIEENQNPELAASRGNERARVAWKKQGRDSGWVNERIQGIAARNSLTDLFKEAGVTEGREYAKLTNQVHTSVFGESVQEHKALKGLKKNESLRDNMVLDELIFTSSAEGLIASEMKRGSTLTEAQQKQAEMSRITREGYEKVYGRKLATSERPNQNQLK